MSGFYLDGADFFLYITYMEILSREVTASGLYRITSSESGSFYIRPDYLENFSNEFLMNTVFNEEQTALILDAGLITAAECKAVEYLARSEQFRTGLIKKLVDKGYLIEHIEPALNYLESKNYLSDARYCRSWLNTRKINHAEGRTRLFTELSGRGIPRDIVKTALDEFFEENSENEAAEKCYKKLVRKGKTGDKLIAAMIQQGFSYKTASILIKNEGVFPEE